MYEVPLRGSEKRKITVSAVLVAAIYNGPPAVCPQDITWRFWQTRAATAHDLHQPGGATDICIGMDYPFLQPST
jgi:hypothetical protein